MGRANHAALIGPRGLAVAIILSAGACSRIPQPSEPPSQAAKVARFNRDDFPDYPCRDSLGRPATCPTEDAAGYTVRSRCVDQNRKPVRCVQMILVPPGGPPPPYGQPTDQETPKWPAIGEIEIPVLDTKPRQELVFRDSDTRVTLRSHADGRYVSATDEKGRLLWSRDPFSDADIEPYRYAVPRINFLGAPPEWIRNGCALVAGSPSGRCVAISYDSTQFGLLDVRTGRLGFMGQD
jgi:hypothetical protein